MSDVDEANFSDSAPQHSGSFPYSPGAQGPAQNVLKTPLFHHHQGNIERKHRRSESEQLFPKPILHKISSKSHIRGRLRKKSVVDGLEGGDGDEDADLVSLRGKYGGESLCGYNTGWDYGSHSGTAAYLSDFSPFERSGEALNQQQSSTGRPYGGTHLKQALKRTVKKALNSGRTDDEDIAESSLNDNSSAPRDTRLRHRKLSGDRRRHHKRSAQCDDYLEVLNMSDNASAGGTSDSTDANSDGQVADSQKKQSRIRVSLADLFSRVKRSMSAPSLNEEITQIYWNCVLTIRYAKLRERINCCVHVFYMDKFIAKSSFSGETSNPRWNERFSFPVSNVDGALELQVIEKHTIRADKLAGRAYIRLHRDDAACSHEAPINFFSIKERHSLTLGILYADTSIKPSMLKSLDEASLFEPLGDSELPEEGTSATTSTSFIKKPSLHRNFARKLVSRAHRHRLRRSKKRQQVQSSMETLYESTIKNGSVFYFSPYEATRKYLENEAGGSSCTVPWRPFYDWPGHRCLQLPMVAIQRQYPTRFWDLRIPKLPWPIEFLLPMTRLAFPTANLVDSLDVGDAVRVTKIVESGVVNVYLVGARGLRSMPQVEVVSACERDGGGGGFSDARSAEATSGKVAGGSIVQGSPTTVCEDRNSTVGLNSSNLSMVSPETRAASLVALHWAAKSLTLQPSPQVDLFFGNEKRSSTMVRNNSNPNFMEEFEFRLTNGSPGFIRVVVYDRETQPGTGGIPRSPILGETLIDLTDMPLELTQKMELQLLKNSNEARILMFVTITGLNTAARSPVQTRDHQSFAFSPPSTLSGSRSVLSFGGYGEGREARATPVEREEKAPYPSLPTNYLKLVAEHFNARNSFTDYQDIGWMRLKICSAMGLGGKSPNGRIEIFCVVDIVNTHLRTQNVMKGKNPTWNRCFVIPLSDIHGIMKLTVIEAEKNKSEVIGALAVHPLRVDNGGSKWYALKTPDLRRPTKGSILLEVSVYFNQFKSALKSFTPLEPRYRNLEKKQKEFHREQLRLLHQRFGHVKPLLELLRWCGRVLDDWWLWKNPIHSVLGLIGYQLFIYYFKPYFVPLYMVIVLLKNRVYNHEDAATIIHGMKLHKDVAQLASPQEHEIYKHQYEILEKYINQNSLVRSRSLDLRNYGEEGDDYDLFDYSTLENEDDFTRSSFSGTPDLERTESFSLYNFALPELSDDRPQEEEEKKNATTKSEGKKSMRTRYTDMKETLARIFDIVEKTASFYERVEGLFNWRIPWISSLAVVVLLLLTVTLFFIPVKYLLMLWGLNKFTKAILRPNALSHNEIMDFLSRVPNLIEAVELTEYRPDAFTITPKGKNHKG